MESQPLYVHFAFASDRAVLNRRDSEAKPPRRVLQKSRPCPHRSFIGLIRERADHSSPRGRGGGGRVAGPSGGEAETRGVSRGNSGGCTTGVSV